MKIDYKATKEKLFATGRAITKWSRIHDLPPGTVAVVLNGRFVTNKPTEGVHGKIIAALDSDGFLVRLPDDDQEQAA